MAMFIRVDVNDELVAATDGLAAKLIEVCPVKIFKAGADTGSVAVVEDNVDECTLCDLCLQGPEGSVSIVKLYED